jgi:hypothetical protein
MEIPANPNTHYGETPMPLAVGRDPGKKEAGHYLQATGL